MSDWQADASGKNRIRSMFGSLPAVKGSEDLNRILAIPRRPPVRDPVREAALVALMNSRLRVSKSTCRCGELGRPCITSLKPAQAWALYEAGIAGGVLGVIGVGHGKTGLDILAPLVVPDCKVAVILAPPGLRDQFYNDYLAWREHFRVPSLIMDDGRSQIVRGAPVLHFIPFSRLSRPEATALLESIQPDTIIVDEAHRMRHATSAATKRFIRYFAAHPETRALEWSGTLTSSSVKDYCLDPATRVLTTDLHWVRADEIVTGDSLIGFDEEIKRTKLRPATVEGVASLVQPRVKIVTDRGTTISSDTHKWILRDRPGTCRGAGKWIDSRDVREGDLLAFYTSPWDFDSTREGGYLAGLLDGEGWVSGAGGQIGFGQKPGTVLDAYCDGLRRLGFTFSKSLHKSGVVRVIPNGDCPHMRLLGMLRPSRLMAKAALTWLGKEPAGRNTQHARVLSVECLEPGRVIAIQTDTKTLIAEGFLTHNCHLAAFALGLNSPLPLDPNVAEEWSTALDPSDDPAPAGALDALCAPGESVEKGFHRRLVETRGVISTTTGAVDAAINLYDRPVKVPPEITKMLRRLRDPNVEGGWTRPDGEDLVDILEVQACARQLACGFYYRWKFPKGEPEALILEWFARRKAWHKELRERLQRGTEHLDSPRLLQNAAERYHANYKGPLPVWAAETWRAWADIADQVEPEQDVVWVDDFLARDAAEWLAKHRGILWYAFDAFAEKVASLSGAPKHGGGPDAGTRIDAEKGDRAIIASIKAHGTGRDGLQTKFRTQLVANPPESWEQLLGRLHRIGTTADEVDAHVYRHTEEYRSALDTAIKRAKYVEGTMGVNQKLLAANCDFDFAH